MKGRHPSVFCAETYSGESGPALTCGANAAQCRAEPDTKMITIIYKIHGLRQGFQKRAIAASLSDAMSNESEEDARQANRAM